VRSLFSDPPATSGMNAEFAAGESDNTMVVSAIRRSRPARTRTAPVTRESRRAPRHLAGPRRSWASLLNDWRTGSARCASRRLAPVQSTPEHRRALQRVVRDSRDQNLRAVSYCGGTVLIATAQTHHRTRRVRLHVSRRSSRSCSARSPCSIRTRPGLRQDLDPDRLRPGVALVAMTATQGWYLSTRRYGKTALDLFGSADRPGDSALRRSGAPRAAPLRKE